MDFDVHFPDTIYDLDKLIPTSIPWCDTINVVGDFESARDNPQDAELMKAGCNVSFVRLNMFLALFTIEC